MWTTIVALLPVIDSNISSDTLTSQPYRNYVGASDPDVECLTGFSAHKSPVEREDCVRKENPRVLNWGKSD